jgi:WXG100 family type VII secretion target
MAEIVQCDHEAIPGIARRFDDLAQRNRQQMKKVEQQILQLEGGDWIGPNATSFFQLMDDQYMPAYERLCAALERAGEVVQEISKLIRDAEEESKGYFPS